MFKIRQKEQTFFYFSKFDIPLFIFGLRNLERIIIKKPTTIRTHKSPIESIEHFETLPSPATTTTAAATIEGRQRPSNINQHLKLRVFFQ